MIPHRTIDKLGVEKVVKLLRFTSHDTYGVSGVDLNDLCALQARLFHPVPMDPAERAAWAERVSRIISDALEHNLTERM